VGAAVWEQLEAEITELTQAVGEAAVELRVLPALRALAPVSPTERMDAAHVGVGVPTTDQKVRGRIPPGAYTEPGSAVIGMTFDEVLDGIPTWSATASWRGPPTAAARLGVLHSRGVLRLRPRHETAAPRPGGDQNLPALPQHHAADAGARVQAVHGVLCPGCAVEASAIRGLQHLRYRRRGLTRDR
jgi:hypothetical protein